MGKHYQKAQREAINQARALSAANAERLAKMDSHDIFAVLQSLTPTRKIKNGWARLMFTGRDSELDEYRTGFVDVRVYVIPPAQGIDTWAVRGFLKDVDDGTNGAWIEYLTEQQARAIVERVRAEWMEETQALPLTFAELNNEVLKFGLVFSRE